MIKRYPQMQWFCKDMRTLEGDDDLGQFDVIIEKGTLDVLFVKDKSPWEASPTTKHDMKRTTDSIYRYSVISRSNNGMPIVLVIIVAIATAPKKYTTEQPL